MIFRFDEPVEGNFGAVRVYDANGDRVDEGDAFHPDGEGPRLGVHLKPGLPDGSYTATYRVISADGHIVSSGFVFSIGKAGRAPEETVAQLTAGSGSGPVTETAFGIARGLQYVAIALAVGGLAFLLLAWLPALAAVGGGGGALAAGCAGLRRPAAPGLPARRGARRGQRRRRGRARGRRGGGHLRLLGAQGVDRQRDAGNQVRDDLGPRRPRLGRLRPARCACVAPGTGEGARGLAAGGAARRPAGLRRPRPGALGTRQHPVAGRAQLPGQRHPRRRDGGLARWPRRAALRRPAGDQGAGARRSRPAAGGGAVAVLAGGAGRGRGDPPHRPDPGLRLRPPPRRPDLDRLRPRRADQVLPADGADRDRRLQPAPLGAAAEPDRRRGRVARARRG